VSDLEQRVKAIEDRLSLEAELRASVDSDLSDIAQSQRAAGHLIQALAITQSQHGETLAAHSGSLRNAHRKLDLIVTMLNRPTDETDLVRPVSA